MNQPDSAHPLQPGEQARRGGSRVAFFGGSFDPPHLGHLAVARAARAAFRLDTVLFAPVGVQPLKPEGSAASFEQRLAMTRLAIAGEPGLEVSLADAPRPSGEHQFSPNYIPNYTFDTLEGLRARLAPECALFCLMGADTFFGLRRWRRAAEIPFVAPLIVASRPGQPLAGLKAALPLGLTVESTPDGDSAESGVEVRAFVLVNQAGDRAPFYLLPGLDVEISASDIRAQIHAAAEDLVATTNLLPPTVAGYIRSHALYRGSGVRVQGSGDKVQ
jgi:nicotinate-nucleotide adenylyltransferase